MAIATQQTVTGSGTSVSSFTLTSWTPSANELILVWVAVRQTVSVSSISGNGITFANVIAHQDNQSQCRLELWRGMSASPSTGQITVNLSSSAVAVIAAAHRISGVDTSGSNGSGAIGASASADTGAVDTDAPSVDITTTTSNSRVYGGATHRSRTYTVGTGETAISINNSIGTAGDTTTISTEYQDVASASTVTINGTLNSALDWVQGAAEVKPALISFTLARSSTTTSPDTSGLAVLRALALARSSATTTPDTVNMSGVPISFTLSRASTTTTPDTVVLARTMSLALSGASATTTPDTTMLARSYALGALSRTSAATTPDTANLIAAIFFSLTRSSATTTPDTGAVAVLRRLGLNAQSISQTTDVLAPLPMQSFTVAAASRAYAVGGADRMPTVPAVTRAYAIADALRAVTIAAANHRFEVS